MDPLDIIALIGFFIPLFVLATTVLRSRSMPRIRPALASGPVLFPVDAAPAAYRQIPVDATRGVDPILREAVDELADGLVIYDRDGVVIFTNDAAETHFRVRHGERLNPYAPSFGGAQVFQTDGKPLRRDETVQLETILTGARIGPVERQLRYQDGGTLNIMLSGAPLYDSEGCLRGAVCALHDLSPWRKEERDRIDLWRGDLLRRMAGGIAHDYNNFLTVILGNISLVRELAADHPELDEMLAAIEVASTGAKTLTRQLLAISRGDTLAPGTSDLGDVVAQVRRRILTDRRVRCDVNMPQGMPSVSMGAEALQQVVEELLITAAESMPSGGMIRVQAQTAEDGIVMTVQDEGAGFPEQDLPHIFDPYFTSWHGGHGLGLASSRATVERHGGSISVDSQPGVGTTFRLQLPIRPRSVRPAAQRIVAIRRILLMDDDPGVLMVAERMLRRLGHDVVTAVDGDDAVRQFIRAEAEGTPVDLAILDLTVPGGTGGEVAAKRLHEMSPDVPLIVSSGYASGDVLTHYELYGFSGVILKPYRLEELAKGIARVAPQTAADRMDQPKLWE